MKFWRKIYQKLLEWKEESNGTKALLIEGARRIGKSTIVEEFAKNEYKSYMLISQSRTLVYLYMRKAFFSMYLVN